jgi:hypothetical protein
MGVFSDSKEPLAFAGLTTSGSNDSQFQTTIKMAFNKQNKPFPNFFYSRGRYNPDVSGIYTMKLRWHDPTTQH